MNKQEGVDKICKYSIDNFGTQVFNREELERLSVVQLKLLSKVFAFEDPNDGSDSNEKEAKRRRGVDTLTATEIDDILQASAENLRDYVILLLFAKNGFQPGEVYGEFDKKSKEWRSGGLRKRDINFSNQTIDVYSVRGESKRVIYIDAITFGLLRRYIKKKDLDDYIFHDLTYDELIGLPRKYRRRTKVEKLVSCRSFRHFFITSQLKKGVDLAKVQYVVGHRSQETTRKYMALK